MEIIERPNWQQYFKSIVNICSTRSSCKKLKVGCLIVNNNRIIAQGYNGFLSGCEHKSIIQNNHEMATIHAEINALCDCAKRGVSSNNSVAYITHYPCINCMKSLISSGIIKIYYVNDYNNDKLVKYFSDISNVEIIKI